MIELKKSALVIVPYTVITVGLVAALLLKAITFREFSIGLGALNVPALLGLRSGKGDDDDEKGDPPPPPPSPSSTTLPKLITPIMLVALGGSAEACSGLTPAQKAAAAETTYEAEQLKCVDDATTLAESKECRRKVRQRWARDPYEDAGAP